MTIHPPSVLRRDSLGEPIERLRRLVEIRAVEEAVQELYNLGHVRGSTHLCSGQEAVSVGLASVTRPSDKITCTYRGHGTALALGVTPTQVLGEICGRTVGCAGGLGGSMHLCGVDVGLFPTFAIVGAGIPVAVGAALSASLKGSEDVAVAIFGDGATNIGAFHESLNLASIWKLPVVFVIENNLYGEYTALALSTPVEELAVRAGSYGMRSMTVDGQDLDQVMKDVGDAVQYAREGGGPTLVEAKTYRYSGHSRSDAGTYRPPGELDAWLARDPIDIYSQRLLESEVLTSEQFSAMRESVAAEITETVEAVLASPEPPVEEMFRHVLA
jgi:acetoin:2,6-dichlorophenolindophenol oxidoreductase subunit alpha